jgi:hypothetical protein
LEAELHRIRAHVPAAIAIALVATVLGAGSYAKGTSTRAEAGNPAPIHGTYSPSIDPANFVSRINNPYLPFKPGTKYVYKGVAEDGRTPQTDTEFVTHRKKLIMGVECTVVRDIVSSRSRAIERTHDWYAQDKQGNVWYFGEDTRELEHGRFVKQDDSWKSGVDGAKPGIIMEGHPRTGDQYRQEYYPGHALDQAKVLGNGGPVTVPYRSFASTLVTQERSPLEPSVRERKWSARGVGYIQERTVRGDHEQIKLISVTH